MFHRDRVDNDLYEDVGVDERQVVWTPWSPAQAVALILGIVYLVVGAAALARTGLNADTFTSTHVMVFGIGQTALMGVIELIFGLLLIMAGAVPGAGRGLMVFAGALALGCGVVVLAATANMYDALGVTNGSGWFYVVTGIILLVAATISPVFFSGSRRAVEYDRGVGRRYHFFH